MSIKKSHFETEVCSRCHGSGKYSFCQKHGDKCFKCSGKGIALTKRGVAAKAYFETLCSKLASNIKIGDRVSTSGITHGGSSYNYIGVVTGIKSDLPCTSTTIVDGLKVDKVHEMITFTITHDKFGSKQYTCGLNHNLRVYNDDNNANIVKALEYQNTLTKQGKVKKI